MAFKSGGIFGKGLGASTSKLFFLPGSEWWVSIDLPTPESIESCAADPTGHHLAVARKVFALPIPLFVEITDNCAAATGVGDQVEGACIGADAVGPNQTIQACAVASRFHNAWNQMHAGSRQTVAIKAEHIAIGVGRYHTTKYTAGFGRC